MAEETAPATEQANTTLRPDAKCTADMNVEQTKTIPREAPVGKSDCPKGRINFGVFFDGTWNDNRDDKSWASGEATNVAKLYKLYQADKVLCDKIYIEGVGTEWYTSALGGGAGAGGQNRIERAFTAVTDFFNKGNNPYALQKVIDVYGFSRGAAQAREFVNRVNSVGIGDKTQPGKKDPNRPGDQPTYPRMSGVKVRFLGIFDTVASFGVPGNSYDVGYNFNVNSKNVERTAHAVAEDEFRTTFPLQSIKSSKDAKLPDNMVEKSFPGAHSNIGAGYGDKTEEQVTVHLPRGGGRTYTKQLNKPNDGAKIPLKWMYDEGQKAGVEMDPMPNDKQYQPSAEAQQMYDDPARREEYRKTYVDDSRYMKIDGDRTIYYQSEQSE